MKSLKNISLATRLSALVAVVLLIAAALVLQSVLELQSIAGERAAASMQRSILLLCVGLLGAMTMAWLVIRDVKRQLGADPSEAAAIAGRIARGDYDFTIRSDAPEDSLLAALDRMKASLEHSQLDFEGQLKAIGSVQAVVELTPDGLITAANANFLRGTGYTADEVLGKHHSLLVEPAERERQEYRSFWAALRAGQPQEGVFHRINARGEERWVRGVYAPILGKDGKPFKIVNYASDITAQRRGQLMNAAFKGALEKLGTQVMVADNNFEIVYVNEATRQLIATAHADLRKDLPNLDGMRLVGQSLDNFSRNPAQQRRLLADLAGTHTTECKLGGRTLRQVASPMKDESGRRLGTVIEWFDRTQEVATELELQEVIGGVADGDLTRRIDLAGKSGFFETLSRGMNDLVDIVGTVVLEVQELVAAANGGDLMRRVRVGGKAGLLVKIGGGINQLTDNMARVVAQVKLAAGEVSRGADEISQGTTNLSQRTEQQASSLEETASSMEQMTSTVRQNADNAGQANQLAVAARDQAERGGAVVAKAVRAMADINDASKKIADIIGVIDEIAFQTNLLALNAAVEAARAGEQGRGFAVVAAEVRNLAGRSATAAKEIKALIKDSVRKVDEGSSLVTQSGATLDQIVAAVKKVTDIVGEIAAASHEQSAGIGQVNKAVLQLDELTQQNAALVEQASAASQAMAEQARGLNERMSAYKVDVTRFAADESQTERRKADRPWSRPAQPAKAVQPTRSTVDQVWKEF